VGPTCQPVGPICQPLPSLFFSFPLSSSPASTSPPLSLSLEFAWRPGGPPPPRALRRRSSTPSNRRRPFSPPSPPTRSAAAGPPPPPSLSSPVPHPLRSPLPSLGHRPVAGLAVLNTGMRMAHPPHPSAGAPPSAQRRPWRRGGVLVPPPPSRLWRRPDPRRPCSLSCGPAPSSSSPAMAGAWPAGGRNSAAGRQGHRPAAPPRPCLQGAWPEPARSATGGHGRRPAAPLGPTRGRGRSSAAGR